MQVTLETSSGLERRMRISVPAEKMDSQVDLKLKEAAGQVKIKGFRPGKVPMREVKRRFEQGIRQEVVSDVMQSSFADAVQQESVFPAGAPQIVDVSSFEAGKDLEFTAVFEVFPEIALTDFSDIKIERPASSVEEDDINKMIETLRDQRVEFKECDRESRDGDKVNIDFEGFVDGEAFDGGKAEGNDLVIGSGSMIPGFEEGIIGAKTGDEKEVKVKFPDEYQSKELAGKDALFKIKLNTVSEPERPTLDKEFFKGFGVEKGGMKAFRTEVSSNMEKELKAAIKNKVKSQVMDGLLATNNIDLPKALIDREIDRLRQEAVQQFGGNNSIDPSMLPAEMFTSQAEKRVTLGLLVNAIVEQQELKADDEKVKQMIEDMASSYEDPQEVINHYYGNEQQLTQIQNLVLEDTVIEAILDKANVEEVQQGYEEAIKPPVPAEIEASADEEEAKDDALVDAKTED